MRSILLIFGLLSFQAFSKTEMTSLKFDETTVRDDFRLILKEAGLPDAIDVRFEETESIKLQCKSKPTLIVGSSSSERTSAFYKALREIGFLFPYPSKQISPTLQEIKKKCGSSWVWKPALKYRGFHLHTLHPNEWVGAFYQNHPHIAEQTVRWMARNQQNIFDLSLLDVPLSEIKRLMRPHFELAQKFQIYTGVSLGIALNQQNSYKLLSLWDSYFGWSADEKIIKGINDLTQALPLSYVVLEAGSSEFTPTDFQKTLNWLNLSAKTLRQNNVAHFTKVHVSSNQISEKWGNYNFLPQYADPGVGILPHTVMFYGLLDSKAPMYGNKNFHGIRDFMVKENAKRPTWYYPETSYWVGMDVDIPLFLTDYLRTRTEDTKFLYENGIEGQLNFTTGHALGYWMFDWTYTLMNDLDYKFESTVGLKLLGEDLDVWKKIYEYQKHWYKDLGVISVLSSANLQDELSETHRIHDRNTMKQLSNDPDSLNKEIELIQLAQKATPDYTLVKNPEIRILLEINNLRLEHALKIRFALKDQKSKSMILDAAKVLRESAKQKVMEAKALGPQFSVPVYEKWPNPTAYQFGYAFPAASLYFWEREERQIREDSYFPFWNNMYDVIDIVL